MAGERANMAAGGSENEATRGLIGNYSDMVGATPIRTPRAPQEGDRIANEIRNARARTETQSALMGGENTILHEGESTTGYGGAAPSKQISATPNPLATPFRQANGIGATPARGPSATPYRTPRDNFRLNQEDGMQHISQTPRDMRLREQSLRSDLRSKLSSLPKPKETEWDLELPEEQIEHSGAIELSEEDAALRDARNKAMSEAAQRAEFRRQSQVVQRGLPRPSVIDIDAMLKNAADMADPVKGAIAKVMALMMANDALKFGGSKVRGASQPVDVVDEDAVNRAKMEIALEVGKEEQGRKILVENFGEAWEAAHEKGILPGLAGYGEDEIDEAQLLTEAFDNMQDTLTSTAEKGNALEKKLNKIHGGYFARSKTLQKKIAEAADFLARTKMDIETATIAQAVENAGIDERLEKLRVEVGLVSRLEREAQEVYRTRRQELDGLTEAMAT